MRFGRAGSQLACVVLAILFILPAKTAGADPGFVPAELIYSEAFGLSEDLPLSGDIWAYRENYVPREFHPVPAWMVVVDWMILVLILFSGLFLVLKRKPARWLSWLAVITLVYLGVFRGGCICPVGAITNITTGIKDPNMVGLVTTGIFLVPLVVSLIAGRIFCTAGCPLGAVQHLFYKEKNHFKLPVRLNSLIKIAPIGILIAAIWLAARGSSYLVCELDPYKPIFFTGQAWFEQLVALVGGRPMESRLLLTFTLFAWGYLAVVLAVGYWIPRPFCRLLCPYGVLLGLVSVFGFKRRRIEHTDCSHCGLCARICPTQAIYIDRSNRQSKLSVYDCIQCNKCNESCKNDAIR